jgi:hypothetical protein
MDTPPRFKPPKNCESYLSWFFFLNFKPDGPDLGISGGSSAQAAWRVYVSHQPTECVNFHAHVLWTTAVSRSICQLTPATRGLCPCLWRGSQRNRDCPRMNVELGIKAEMIALIDYNRHWRFIRHLLVSASAGVEVQAQRAA